MGSWAAISRAGNALRKAKEIAAPFFRGPDPLVTKGSAMTRREKGSMRTEGGRTSRRAMGWLYTALWCAVALASAVVASPATAQEECRGESTDMVCGFVWNDANTNGLQDLGETGLGGKLVTLSDGMDTVPVYTDASGFFVFYDVTGGSYTLSIETSAIGPTAVPSTPNAGEGDVDSDGLSNGTTSSVSFEMVDLGKVDFDFGSVCGGLPPRLTRLQLFPAVIGCVARMQSGLPIRAR